MCWDHAECTRTGFKPVQINPVGQVRGSQGEHSSTAALSRQPGTYSKAYKQISCQPARTDHTTPYTQNRVTSTEQADCCVSVTPFCGSLLGKLHLQCIVPLFSVQTRTEVLRNTHASLLVYAVILKTPVRDSQRSPRSCSASCIRPLNHQWLHDSTMKELCTFNQIQSTENTTEALIANLIIAHSYVSIIYPGWSYVTALEVSFSACSAPLSSAQMMLSRIKNHRLSPNPKSQFLASFCAGILFP